MKIKFLNIKSALGHPAIYKLDVPDNIEKVEAVLMDLDGTTVHSETFWMWIIERVVAKLMEDDSFRVEDEDVPHIAGHSISEHLKYCIASTVWKKQ